ncbi:MAG TPA: RIP metalloprotease RseP [Gammaproteobacteria bacterium]
MSQLFISIFAFILALGILVAIHEFGHFWVARRLGVKVLRFSLGFGKVIWRRQGGETEYVLSALPLGGYVKMLGEQDDNVAEHERHRAFSTQPVWKRIAIVAAGPLANFILAAFLYICVFLIGIPGVKPVIGKVEPDSYAAAAGFAAGDLITAVSSVAVDSWQDVRLLLLENVLMDGRIEVSVTRDAGVQLQRVLSFDDNDLLQREGDVLQNIGFIPWQPLLEPVIAEIKPGEAAARAGIQVGDRIVMADGQPVAAWLDWVDYVRSRPDTEIRLTVLRNGSPVETTIVPAAKEENGKIIGFIGAGVRLDEANAELDAMRVIVHYPLLESISRGLAKTWDMTAVSFRMIGKLIVGDASPKNISGPITIAEYAGKTFSIDLRFFLDFLAIVSIGLAVLNILPVPMLDGGHLLYYLIELLTGKPLPEKIQLLGQNIGIFLLACLMSLAFYNDIVRLLG